MRSTTPTKKLGTDSTKTVSRHSSPMRPQPPLPRQLRSPTFTSALSLGSSGASSRSLLHVPPLASLPSSWWSAPPSAASAVVYSAAPLAAEALPGGSPESSGGSVLTVLTHVATLLRMASAPRLGKRKSLLMVPSTSTVLENSCSSTTLLHGLLLAATCLVQSLEPSICASPAKHELLITLSDLLLLFKSPNNV